MIDLQSDNGGENNRMKIDTNNGPTLRIVPQRFLCPVHGETEHTIHCSLPEYEGTWCLLCALRLLDMYGVPRVERVEGAK